MAATGTSKFTVFKQHSWSMEIDPSVLDYRLKPPVSPASHSLSELQPRPGESRGIPVPLILLPHASWARTCMYVTFNKVNRPFEWLGLRAKQLVCNDRLEMSGMVGLFKHLVQKGNCFHELTIHCKKIIVNVTCTVCHSAADE